MRHRLTQHVPQIIVFAASCMLMIVSVGCQQTTGITPGSPLTPVSPLAPNGLSPIQPTSAVGPLGQSTRVPPPSTGSYSVPNNYMGGQVPLSQTNSYAPNASAAGGWQGSSVAPVSGLGPGPVGSGVAQAGGINGGGIHSGFANGSAMSNGMGGNPNANLRPQSGGMQVIDLTGAPPPPGYRSPSFSQGNQFPSPQHNQMQPGGFQNQNPGFQQPLVPYNPQQPTPGVIQSTPSMLPPLSQSNSPPPVTLPDARLQAGAVGGGFSATGEVGQQNLRSQAPLPSTAPVRTADRSPLSWRSPAPRF